MIRYLDNNDNRRTSPNQNFGRELLELSCSASATTPNPTSRRRLRHGPVTPTAGRPRRTCGAEDWHDANPKLFLGQTINTDPSATARRYHGREVIDTVLGNGIVPVGLNAGRQSRAVAAEFISKKLWAFFAGSTPSQTVIDALRDVAIANDF